MRLKDLTEQDLKDFVEEYVKSCLVEMYDHVRLDKEHTDWNFVSRNFTLDDIDYIREFRNYVNWECVKAEIISSKKILKEFEDVIDDEIKNVILVEGI